MAVTAARRAQSAVADAATATNGSNDGVVL